MLGLLAGLAGLITLAGLASLAGAAGPVGRALDPPVKASWVAVPLGEWTDAATAIAGRPVLRHRRLDPERPLSIEADSVPLRMVLAEAARAVDAAVEVLDSSIWLVPSDRKGWLEAAERHRKREVAALPPDRRRRALARSAWSWPAGSRPQELVSSAARAGGISLDDLAGVPHDHLPAATLPELTLAERLDLVLAHYDLRVAWADRPRIVPLAGEIVPLADEIVPLAGAAPAAARPPSGGTVARPQSRRRQAAEVYSLRLEASLERALEAVSSRLGLTLELDRESLAARGVLPGEIVRADVREASREQVLDAIVMPIGLRWTIEGSRLRVFAP